MVYQIKKHEDEILRKPTEEVTDFDFELQGIIDNMIETMRKSNGVGLAAPQVGISKRLFVCEFSGDKDSELEPFPLTVVCNPKITQVSEQKINMVEGCLSFPGLEILVKRPKNITIKGQDRYGKPIEIKADDLYARVIQHEYDHLFSTLLVDHIQETNIVFIGTGTLGTDSLEALAVDPQYKVALVVTGETSAVSRTHKGISNPIEEIAKKYKLPVLRTSNIKDPKIIEKIKSANASLGVMADFGQILPVELINLFEHGLINIHPSLLPKHRGPSPIQQTILDGDTITGTSLILTSAKMDAGDIISQARVRLSGSETTTILKNYLAQLSASLLLSSIPYYLAGDLKPIRQDESKATYSRLFKKDDGFVNDQTSSTEVERKIRAFDRWPKVYTLVKNKRIQLISAHFDENRILVIDRVKPESKQEMDYQSFTRGYKTTLTFR